MERKSNFELLRIICMILIVWGHLTNKYSLNEPILGFNYIETNIIKSFSSIAVNVFILISGYFSISFKPMRLLKICQETWFYSVFLLILTTYMGWHTFILKKDILYLCPIFSKKYWFITIYVILYLLAPCLNKLASAISKANFKSILFIGFVILYLWHTLSFILNSERPIDDAGYGIPNFIYLYLLGRYIRLHYNVPIMKQNFIFLYFIISVSLFIFQLIYSLILGFSFTSLYSYNTLFILGGAISLFLFFKELNIEYYPFINHWAKYCLAIYIIHMHPLLWDKICVFLQITHISPIWFIPYSLSISIIMYTTFAIIEKIRLYLFDKVENKINSRIMQTKIAQKIENQIRLIEV